MIRSFVVALVTIVVVAGAGPLGRLAAQNQAAPATISPFPVEIGGGAPGITVEIFLNAGKVGETTLNSTGGGNFILDLANAGKSQMQIYIDVCKDGKVVKVLFVSANGQPPPKDEDCDRRLGAVSFQSDCGVTRITLDLRNFGASVIGCASPFTRPQVIAPVAGGAVLVALLAGGGDGNTRGVTGSPTTTSPPPATAPPPTTTTPPSTPPPAQNTTPPSQTPTEFSTSLAGTTTFHPPGANTSFICGIVIITPNVAGARWTVTGSGPAVLPNQNVTGSFNANGQASYRLGIGNLGPYIIQVSVVANNVTRTATANHNVTSASGNCPSVP